MRVPLAVISLALATGLAVAQDVKTDTKTDKLPSDASPSTGRSPSDATQGQGQMQPQGPTGPLNTTSGGAPAASPQGQTPPGMQAAPEGSSKTIVDNKTDKQPSDSSQSTGRSPSDATKNGGQMQPQGPTGPLNTTSGGAPAASPQGQTPPGMQSAPEGSSKTIADDKKDDTKQ